jgi:hypothetical protein
MHIFSIMKPLEKSVDHISTCLYLRNLCQRIILMCWPEDVMSDELRENTATEIDSQIIKLFGVEDSEE